MESKTIIMIDVDELRSIVMECVESALSKPVEPKYYTRQEVADILHVTLPTLRAMVIKGQIKQEKVGTRVLFDSVSIDAAVRCGSVKRYKHKEG
jgi:excisionase family DNA binding protein